MALSVGKRKHYGVPEITPRHFRETAQLCNFPEKVLEEIFVSIIDHTDYAMEKTMTEMPADFPEYLMNSISNGVKNRIDVMKSVLKTS